MSKKKGLDFFQQKTVPLLCMSHNLFANFLRGSALLSSSAKDGKKESTKGTQKERRSQQNNTSFLSYPSRRITNSSMSFFVLVFVQLDTQGYDDLTRNAVAVLIQKSDIKSEFSRPKN